MADGQRNHSRRRIVSNDGLEVVGFRAGLPNGQDTGLAGVLSKALPLAGLCPSGLEGPAKLLEVDQSIVIDVRHLHDLVEGTLLDLRKVEEHQ